MTQAQAQKEYDRLLDLAEKLEGQIQESEDEESDLRSEIQELQKELSQKKTRLKTVIAKADSLEKRLRQAEKEMQLIAGKFDL